MERFVDTGIHELREEEIVAAYGARVKCSKCGNENTVKASLVHEMGTTNSVAVTAGVGFEGIHAGGWGAAVTTGTSNTLLAQRVAPPQAQTILAVLIGVVAVVIEVSAIIASLLVGFTDSDFTFLGYNSTTFTGWSIFAAGSLVFLLMLGKMGKMANRAEEQRKREHVVWEQMYVCMKCGEMFNGQEKS